MRSTFFFAALLAACHLGSPIQSLAQTPSLQKIWQTDSIIVVPESVLPDASRKWLYVSQIGRGKPEDRSGGVGRLSMDGKTYDSTWVKGLQAPKGLGLYEGKVYVADPSEVVIIDATSGSILKKIPIEGSLMLNDITIDAKGTVYVSDTKTGKLYRIEKDQPQLYAENLSGINGLYASGDSLYILANKAVLVANAAKNIRTITSLPNGGDGVEPVGNGDLIVSEWVGFIYYVYADGRKTTLLDSHLEKKNTADIYYNRKSSTLYVPGFFAKTVTAYKVSH